VKEKLEFIGAIIELLVQYSHKIAKQDGESIYYDDALSAQEDAWELLEKHGFAENMGGNGHEHKLLYEKYCEALKK